MTDRLEENKIENAAAPASQVGRLVMRENFKKEYLTDAFFFVDSAEQFYALQDIAIEFGLKNPVGDTSYIAYDMHDVSKDIAPKPGIKVAKNLTFFPDNRFQKSGFWVKGASYGQPKDYNKFMADYKKISA